ncbi:MAG: 50S ribosomal protein L18 [Lachnospiraceae bacterium]|nr:50S ribosomal protein L18 [Lachnospiraceae bacterium]
MIKKRSRSEVRVKKHMKVRNRLSGTSERPRLAVFRSNNHMYAQIIDDTVIDAKGNKSGATLVAASTLEKEVKEGLEKTNNVDAAAKLGEVIAKKAQDKGIKTVVFDRGGFIYQGKVKALAYAAREAGLEF